MVSADKLSFGLLLSFVMIMAGCSNGSKGSETAASVTNMHINSDGKIVVSVEVDTLLLNLLLDTGGGDMLFLSDSVATLLNLNVLHNNDIPVTYGFESDFTHSITKQRIDTTIEVLIGSRVLSYNKVIVDNDVCQYNVDGILPIQSIEPMVWRIDFDNEILTVTDTLSIDREGYTFDISCDNNSNNYVVHDLTLGFRADQDLLTYSASYLLDTGCPFGIAILGYGSYDADDYDTLKSFLEKNAIKFRYSGYYGFSEGYYTNHMYYIGEHDVISDTLNIMMRTGSGLSANILGMDFLYRFNVIIDIPSLKLYLKKREKQVSVEEVVLDHENSQMSTYLANDGTYIIESINKNGWLYRGGLRRFDRIVKIDGRRSIYVDSGYLQKVEIGDDVVFEILRNGHERMVVVQKDK